ncbi:MAG: methyltransferase domain-containing protein [Bacteroidales bacterium]|jgi:radical SAM protein with 4Fe4S-binding SPASM domain|nr:methyltransferase domain-containing protein [Bacteroidales bacterium]
MKIIEDVLGSYLQKAHGIGKYVLDIGTGSGNMALTLAEMQIRCITIEKSKRALDYVVTIINKSEVKYKPLLLEMDARKLSFYDNTFDYVVSYKSLHHIEKAELSIDEMYRVCKPGGCIIFIEHNKIIRNSMDVLMKYTNEAHPGHMDIDTIKEIMLKRDGTINSFESVIGSILIFTKDGYSENSHNEINSPIILGTNNHGRYFYNYNDSIIECEVLDSKKKREVKLGNNILNVSHSLCLNIATSCNMDCQYCYALGGNYGQEEKLMSRGIAKESIFWFYNKVKHPFHLIFFGGEPLLNKDIILGVLSDKRYYESCSVNTNGIFLDQHLAERIVNGNGKISVSIDGKKETHDNLRKFKDGSPSYDVIVDQLNNLPKNIMNHLCARITINNSMLHPYEEIIALLELGFKRINMSFVMGNLELTETEEQLEIWKYDIDKLVTLSINKWINEGIIIDPFIKMFKTLLIGERSPATCAAGREMLNIQPDGMITPCFRFSNFYLGNIKNGLNFKQVEKFEKYKRNYRMILCDGCWIYRFCGGMCPDDIAANIRIQNVRCNLNRYIVKSMLFHFYNKYISNEIFYRKYKTQFNLGTWIKSIKGDAI